MKKQTKYMLGAGAVIAAYLLWKRSKASAAPAAQVTAPTQAAISAAPATTLSGTSLDGHVLQSRSGRGIFG